MGFLWQWNHEKETVEKLKAVIIEKKIEDNAADGCDCFSNADQQDEEFDEIDLQDLFDFSREDNLENVSQINDINNNNKVLSSVDEQKIADYEIAENNIEKIATLLKHSIEETKDIIPVHAYMVHCDFTEVLDKYQYFLQIFKSEKNLFNVIKWDFIEAPLHYDGIFSYRKETILNKINQLINLFNIDIQGVLKLLEYSSSYLYMSNGKIIAYIKELKNQFECSFEEMKKIYLFYPPIISISRSLFESRAQRMAVYFSKTRDEIIKMYKKYPPAMLVTPSDIESALRFKKNKTEDIKSKIFEMPWAIDCITMEKDDEYCGFQSLEQLLEILQFLSFLFGDVISVQKRKFSKNETLKRFVLFKKNEDYYVVCLGMRTPEDKLLRAIFGNLPKIRYAKIARNKKLNLEESYLTIYEGCGKELDGFSKKYREGKRFLCEVPPLDIFDRLNNCLVLKDGQEQAFARILLLDEKLTEKRTEYVQQLNRDEMTESEWEQREENSINYIFGSLGNFKNYLLDN